MPPKPISPELLSLRRQNALALFVRWRLQEIAHGRVGGDKAFAEAVGIDNAHWSRIKAGTPLGPMLARRMERACGVEVGWLDVAHDESLADKPMTDTPGSQPATEAAVAAALGLSVDTFKQGLPWAESPTRAGFPSPAADERVSRVDLNAELIRHEEATMLVSVKGDSMRDAGIFDGNVLLVDKALNAEHGDIVVAVLDEELTVKRLYRKDGVVKLLPENPDFPEIVPAEGQELRIWGVVTATIRRFRRPR